MENEKLNNGVISLEGEVWKVINHPSIGEYSNYMVSNMGRVKSLNYLGYTGKERILKAGKNRGYLIVDLSKNGRRKTFLVHRLVAEAFLPTIEGKSCVNHKIEGEEGKSMNFVFFKADGEVDLERTTIEWVTHKENNTYGSKSERMKETRKTSLAWKEGVIKTHAKLKKIVYQYTLDLQLINIYNSAGEAAKLTGFSQGRIFACCRGEQNSHKNYIWSYEPLECFQYTLFPLTEKKIS